MVGKNHNTDKQKSKDVNIEYEKTKIDVHGGTVMVFFPKVITDPDTMAKVREILITSYVSDTISNEIKKK